MEFVQWCDESFLILNTAKTKDMVIDLRRKPICSPPHTCIKGNQIEVIDQYKYLGTIIDSRLKFDANSEPLCRKGQQRLYYLRTPFNVEVLMTLFYKYFIQSVLTFSFIAWYGSISVKDRNHMSRIVKLAGK